MTDDKKVTRVADLERRVSTLKKIRIERRVRNVLGRFTGTTRPVDKGTDWSKVSNKKKADILVKARDLVLKSRQSR
jgi:hypothetical protein